MDPWTSAVVGGAFSASGGVQLIMRILLRWFATIGDCPNPFRFVHKSEAKHILGGKCLINTWFRNPVGGGISMYMIFIPKTIWTPDLEPIGLGGLGANKYTSQTRTVRSGPPASRQCPSESVSPFSWQTCSKVLIPPSRHASGAIRAKLHWNSLSRCRRSRLCIVTDFVLVCICPLKPYKSVVLWENTLPVAQEASKDDGCSDPSTNKKIALVSKDLVPDLIRSLAKIFPPVD